MNCVSRFYYLGKDMRTEKIAPVVLVYLFGHINRIPHVLLMRRSSHVGYMKNAWSVIAGFVNGDTPPERQAMAEIVGETGLFPNEVTTPYIVGTFTDDDEQNQKQWRRYLLCVFVAKQAIVAEEFGVRLDWEHSEAAWVPVEIILDWLSGKQPTDPVAHAILCDEEATPDFKLNLGRIMVTMRLLSKVGQ